MQCIIKAQYGAGRHERITHVLWLGIPFSFFLACMAYFTLASLVQMVGGGSIWVSAWSPPGVESLE